MKFNLEGSSQALFHSLDKEKRMLNLFLASFIALGVIGIALIPWVMVQEYGTGLLVGTGVALLLAVGLAVLQIVRCWKIREVYNRIFFNTDNRSFPVIAVDEDSLAVLPQQTGKFTGFQTPLEEALIALPRIERFDLIPVGEGLYRLRLKTVKGYRLTLLQRAMLRLTRIDQQEALRLQGKFGKRLSFVAS